MNLEQLIVASAPLRQLEEKALLAIIAQHVSGWTPTPAAPPREIYSGTVDDPNGAVTPDNPQKAATYYKEQSEPLKLWLWNVSTQTWFPVVT